jgi:hypothetical protein
MAAKRIMKKEYTIKGRVVQSCLDSTPASIIEFNLCDIEQIGFIDLSQAK